MKSENRQDGRSNRPSVRRRRRASKRLWMAGSLTLCAGLPAASTYAAITVTTTTNADALVNALVGASSGITVVPGSATYTGAANASGTFTGGDFLPFNDGIVLTTGDARTGVSPGPGQPPDAFVIPGPNNSGAAGIDNLAAGDADVAGIAGVPTNMTFNASVLQFSFIPTTSSIRFQFVFGSEEYNEFVGSTFNDAFGFFLNGQNLALVPGTPDRISVNTIHGAVNNGFGTFQPQNGQYFTDNTGGSLNTQLDGLAGVATALFADGTVVPGQVNTIKLAIADVSDAILDSAVFLPAQGFAVVPVPPGPPSPPTPPVPPSPPGPPAAVPTPEAFWMGLSTLGSLGLLSKLRRRK